MEIFLKINNKKNIRFYMSIIYLLFLLDFILLIACLLYPLKKQTLIVILIFLFFGLFVLSTAFWRMRYLEIENSGTVYSIKSYHPLKKGWIAPVIEFPPGSLYNFSLRNGHLYLQLKRYNGMISESKLSIKGLSKKDTRRLQENFSTVLNKLSNNNGA